MDKGQSEELLDTFIEEFESSIILKDAGRMKSATILASKALFALCDHIILTKYGKFPKNHSERFRILEFKEPKIYSKVNAVWSKYTDTYSKPTEKESYNILIKTITEIIKDERIDTKIKTFSKR
jgi:hypothetical protein